MFPFLQHKPRTDASLILSFYLLLYFQILPNSGRTAENSITRPKKAMVEYELSTHDLEHGAASEPLYNSSIKDLCWHDVTVTVNDRKTKAPKRLLDNVTGEVKAGERPSRMIYCLYLFLD